MACVPGKYKNITGSVDCTSCPSGKTSLPKNGAGIRCVCVTPTPFLLCDCLEATWRENRDPEHVPTFIKMGVRIGYIDGLADFQTDKDIQEKFRWAFANVALPGDQFGKYRIEFNSVTQSDGIGCSTASSIDIDVFIRPRPNPPLPYYEINPTLAEPVRVLMSSSEAETDINSNLTARGVPQLCFMRGPDVVTLGRNKDLWDAGLVERTLGWYPEELNKSVCYP